MHQDTFTPPDVTFPPNLTGFRLDPERWYSEHELRQLGGAFTDARLRRARLAGRLQFSEVARGQRLYKGEWLTAWLQDSAGGKEGGVS